MSLMKTVLFVITTMISTVASAAAGRGGHSMGAGLILSTATQEDLNTVISEINSSETRSVDKLGSAYEFAAFYQYRFSGSMFALQFRPSYLTQSAKGSSYETKLSGFTVFPMLRMYPLENNFIRFFMQTGLGWGRLSGSMSGPNGSVDWAGSAFGAMGGLGAEFCFTPAHCVVVEGNIRYLPIERNVVTGVSGTPSGFDTVANNGELENDNMDVKTSMSGIQGALHYQMNF